MPKWTDKADRDLIFAILIANMDRHLKVKVPWAKVESQMIDWGYVGPNEFTRKAITLRWSMKILKEFRDEQKAKDGNSPQVVTEPVPKKSSGGRKRKAASFDNSVDDDDESDLAETLKKRRKMSAALTPGPVLGKKKKKAAGGAKVEKQESEVNDEIEKEHDPIHYAPFAI
ncbi:uncharacterized protein BCR38DRAFT_410004 [Pseudomassariella vexata]|uniref:Uncharacterized protein n=1 Tax=Pseudomassariella vexata TaxID=1141098 RepID=A0A1Y2DV71_9PEZI|nr:uncharacterized protein BCR38DRAFT_410004 [Pseudomassariella vexata]ORY63034.1 hypothetical protein BCR38DRAFT_410004 [Pseudomassariella vexata]